jgi:hypothetical protein
VYVLISRDLNKACPKENFPTHFIDKILDKCAGSEVFSFMDRFSGYNQIQIKPEDQHKMTFICPWGTFAYRKIPFGLKNFLQTSQSLRVRMEMTLVITSLPFTFGARQTPLMMNLFV